MGAFQNSLMYERMNGAEGEPGRELQIDVADLVAMPFQQLIDLTPNICVAARFGRRGGRERKIPFECPVKVDINEVAGEKRPRKGADALPKGSR